MPLAVSSTIADTLPSSVKQSLSKLPEETQATFEEEYKRKMKSPGFMILLAVFFPIHFFLLGKVGLGIVYYLTLAGFGVWYFIEIFLAGGRAKTLNEDLAKTIMRDLKIMGS